MNHNTPIPWEPEAISHIVTIPELFRENVKSIIEFRAKQRSLERITLSFAQESQDDINKLMRVKSKSGMPTARDFFGRFIPRMMAQQGDAASYWIDIDAVMDAITDRESWIGEWSRLGDRYAADAARELERGHTATARRAFWCASHYYQWAHFIIHHPNDHKRALIEKSAAAFMQAGALCEPPVERIEIPFGAASLPAYFRPAPGGRTAPCVISILGTDGPKEEMGVLMQMIHDRGLAHLCFDGPGQSEARIRGILFDLDAYNEAVSSIVDYLETRPDTDAGKIGLWGTCFGGFLALRAAAHDHRIAACINNGGAYSYAEIAATMPPAWITSFQFLTGCENDLEFIKNNVMPSLTLEGTLERITCHTLLLHGTQDPFIPLAQVQRIYDGVRAKKELIVHPDGSHCSTNINHRVWPEIADWICDRLSADERDAIRRPGDDHALRFAPDAERMFNALPFFMKGSVRRELEKRAQASGARVSLDDLQTVKRAFQ